MRKLYILILLAIVSFSCSDELDQLPSDSLPGEESITNVDGLDMAVKGVYTAFVDQFSYAGDIGLYADGRGTDVKIVDQGVNHFQPLVIFQTDKSSGHSIDTYKQFYYVSARVNNILLFTDNIEDKTGNEDTYNDLLGQLYALRALSHFEIARMYSQLPSVASDMNAKNSGIVLNDKYYNTDATFTRSTLTETYDFIVSDLEKALPLLSKAKLETSGAINYWAAKALLARVELYLGNYSDALESAIDVIENSGSELYTRENYLSVWSKKGTSESLFEILTDDILSAQRNSLGYYTNPDGYAECAASDDFATWLIGQSKDIRSKSISLRANAKNKYEAYYTVKYMGLEGASSPLYENNFKVIRLSEMYLIAAEAVLNGGTATGAKSAVAYYNDLRKTRIEDYDDAAVVTIDDILDERRREFFCENQRMFDLVRLKRNIEHPSLGTINYDDFRVIMAIPQREINISEELVQNPKY